MGVYVHGNSGCRLDALCALPALFAKGISLFTYDAVGCGLSEGEYVSLGWHERDVLDTVIKHIRSFPDCGSVGVWGRSMGAATTLLHAYRDPTLGAVLLDSAFSSLPLLVEELARDGSVGLIPLGLPNWLLDAAVSILRGRVQALADFDINDVVPLKYAVQSSVPAFFLHSEGDSFIKLSHSQALFDAYTGQKRMMITQGDHCTKRSDADMEKAADFFWNALHSPTVPPSVKGVIDLHTSTAQEETSKIELQGSMRKASVAKTNIGNSADNTQGKTQGNTMQSQWREAPMGKPSPKAEVSTATSGPRPKRNGAALGGA